MKTSFGWSAVALVVVVSASACSDKPPEPEKATPPAGTAAQASADDSDEPIVTTDSPIAWDAPAGWSLTETSNTSARRAGYAVPKIGDDKEDAELLVLYFGKGKNGERDIQWDAWFEQFDGNAKQNAKRDQLTVGDSEVETFEFLGNYKLNMGPQRP